MTTGESRGSRVYLISVSVFRRIQKQNWVKCGYCVWKSTSRHVSHLPIQSLLYPISLITSRCVCHISLAFASLPSGPHFPIADFNIPYISCTEKTRICARVRTYFQFYIEKRHILTSLIFCVHSLVPWSEQEHSPMNWSNKGNVILSINQIIYELAALGETVFLLFLFSLAVSAVHTSGTAP